MRVIRTEAHRRIAILVAEKSMKTRKFIGACCRAAGAIPVGRALDKTVPGTGKIYLPDPANDPTLVRGVGTHFDTETVIGGLLVLPTINNAASNADIAEIHGPEELRLKREFKGNDALKQLTGREDVTVSGQTDVVEGFEGTSYKTAPKVDQTQVYDAVFDRLSHDGCVCIFPEGGSHDRPDLLPLKRLYHRLFPLHMS